MEARIKKWGNSLAIRIPQSVAKQIDLEPDLPVSLTINGKDLTISPMRQASDALENLLAKVTDGNRHDEVDFGPAVGEEAW